MTRQHSPTSRPGYDYDAVVVGAGPNGLAAAVTLARAGRSVLVLEANETIGGGTRSAELTLPGFVHDVCSAIHPLAVASPFFKGLPLEEHGLQWIHPDVQLAHPMLDKTATLVHRSFDETVRDLQEDGDAYRRLLGPLVAGADDVLDQVLAPFQWPRHPLLLARFGLRGIPSAYRVATRVFDQERVQGMFAGMAAHAALPLDRLFTAAVGLMFAVSAHSGGWPMPLGGAQRIADALAAYLKSLGGQIVTGVPVRSLSNIPPARAILFDVSPRQLTQITGDVLPSWYRRKLERFRHGPGTFKIDWALDGPIPWSAASCRRAGTVHVGGSLQEVASAEQAAWSSEPAEWPFLLVTQQSLFDSTRAPAGKHTGWAYCHVPHGSTFDMTERIESQMERFAPGFRDLILARHVMAPRDFQSYNANYIGGDISGGAMDIWQMFARPTARLRPYTTPARNIFLCSASTPPGPGVHGMCGYLAAQAVLRSKAMARS